jgi:membrane-associated phospholipid phosphatase
MTEGVRWPRTAAAGAALLAGSWYALSRPVVQRADVRAGDAVRRAGGPVLDDAVRRTTDLGSVYAVCGIATVLAASGRRRTAADVLALGGVAWGVAQASKTRVRRQRPYEAEGVRRLVRPPTGSSFPSGHAAVGVAVLAMLAERARGPFSAAVLRVLAAYVPLSRVYVGVHYPTDVLGGAGLGLLLAGSWRGPVAAGGRLLTRTTIGTMRWTGRPMLRGLVWALLGLRLRGRSPRGRRAAAAGASEHAPPAASPEAA